MFPSFNADDDAEEIEVPVFLFYCTRRVLSTRAPDGEPAKVSSLLQRGWSQCSVVLASFLSAEAEGFRGTDESDEHLGERSELNENYIASTNM